VPPPSAAIAGVPTQFDDLVSCATARDSAERFADAQDMAAELADIVDELGLPAFRVPAPTNSAQHAAATAHIDRVDADGTTQASGRAPLTHTREMTRGPDDWQPAPPATDVVVPQPLMAPTQFAGIEIDEFEWARQRSKRAQLFWVVAVLTLTGLIAAGAWTLGSNLPGLLQ
jgi:serine/threonine protein kinase, bacterial